jgi:hypothetical protein
VAAQNAIPKIVLLDLAFQSSPIGADVYIVGSNEYLGRTPFRRKVEYRDDRTTFVVFRWPGYMEMTKEVRPDFSGAVTLQEVATARGPTPPDAPSPVPWPVVPPHPRIHRRSAQGRSIDKAKPTKPHGKAMAREEVEPRIGRSLRHSPQAGGRKASPFN